MNKPVNVAELVARWSVEHPWTVVFLTLALAVAGAFATQDIPMDAVPDITNVQVVVLTKAPGLGPVEVEQTVTHHVELGLTGIPSVRELRSVSRAGISAVTVVFEDSTDPLLARLQVGARLESIREELPVGSERPELGPFTTGLGEVYHFTVRWPGHDLTELHTVVDWEIGHHLRSVPGVVEVNLWGGAPREFQLMLDPTQMAARGVTLATVHRALLQSNAAVGAGAIERHGAGVILRAEGRLRDATDIESVVLRPANEESPAVRVADVGRVRIGGGMRLGAASADARGELVYVMVQMLAGANARTTVHDVRERLAEIQQQLPDGVEVDAFYDRAEFVDRVLLTVAHNLAEGAFLVVLVLFLALRQLRASLLVASIIPLSALMAALSMRALGVTGNLMSLGAVDFGLLVDGAVVVVESAMVLAARPGNATREQSVAEASAAVARPVAFGVAIIAMVYVPVLTLQGVEGRMFRPMAQVVLSALGAALVLSLTFVPAVLPKLLPRTHDAHAHTDGAFARGYRWLLARAMRHRYGSLSLAVLAVLLSAALGSTLGAEFVPRLDEGSVALQLTRIPSTSLEEGVRGATAVERALRGVPEVTRVVSRTGSPAVATDLMGPEQSDVFVMLRPPATWRHPYDRDTLVNEMNTLLGRALPGCEFGFTQPIEMRMSELLSGIRSDVGVRVFGPELPVLRALGDQVAEVLRHTRGGADVRAEQIDGLSLLSVRPDREALTRYAMPSDLLMDHIASLRAGLPAGTIFEGERHFALVLRASVAGEVRADALADMVIPTEEGAVPLGNLTTLRDESGPAQVSHEFGQRRLVVEANVRNRDLSSYVQEVQRSLARLRLPRGYTLTVGGQYQNLARAARRLAVIVPLVLIAIGAMLRMSLGRWKSALLVFANVPVAISGGVVALWSRSMNFSITAAVGFIALAGIAVLNGLVLASEIDRRSAEGSDPFTAAQEGAVARLRPVMTTATVAALGFVPMALARGTGSEVQRPLATVIIGGLVMATLATLVLLPVAMTLGARAARPLPVADEVPDAEDTV